MVKYATIKPYDIANGDGVRVSIFFSGCTHKCKGCFNEDLWDFDYGTEFTETTIKQIVDLLKPRYISGLSLLGGDPLCGDNADASYKLCKAVKEQLPDKTIWLYSGYNFEDVKNLQVMQFVDIMVDGPFVESKKNISLKFRGSTNQRIIDVKKSLELNTVTQKVGE